MQQGGRAFVIGMGEVGRTLSGALARGGWTVLPVTRRDGWDPALDADDPSPRIVAVREEDLGGVLERCAGPLRSRLVLVQNGFLEAVHGALGPVTRGLIYFTAKDHFFRVLCASPFYGPLAGPIVGALEAGGIPCKLVEEGAESLRAMVVKGIWNAVVGLPLAVHGVDLATYLETFRDELEALIEESALAAGAEYGVRVSAAVAERKILETTTELGWVKGGVKAIAWRNGALAGFGRRHGVPTPVNDRLLRAAGLAAGPDAAHGP